MPQPLILYSYFYKAFHAYNRKHNMFQITALEVVFKSQKAAVIQKI